MLTESMSILAPPTTSLAADPTGLVSELRQTASTVHLLVAVHWPPCSDLYAVDWLKRRVSVRMCGQWSACVCVCVCVCAGVCAAEQGVDGAAGAAE